MMRPHGLRALIGATPRGLVTFALGSSVTADSDEEVDMPTVTQGSVTSLWRYPVKSMQGEELGAAEVTARGLLGDRAYALVDRADGKAATAKNPRKWPTLFGFRAAFIEPPRLGGVCPRSASLCPTAPSP